MQPGAKRVCVVGDFQRVAANSHNMKKQPDGHGWFQIQLTHGHHQYLFWVDGQAQLDPRAQGVARTQEGHRVSLLRSANKALPNACPLGSRAELLLQSRGRQATQAPLSRLARFRLGLGAAFWYWMA